MSELQVLRSRQSSEGEELFKTAAAKTKSGNWNLQGTCDKGHTVFKDQMHPGGPYKCPYCGADVP